MLNSKTLQTIQLELLSHPVFGSFNPHHWLPIECRYEVMCGHYWNSYFPTNYSYPFLLCLYKLRTKDYSFVFNSHATQSQGQEFKLWAYFQNECEYHTANIFKVVLFRICFTCMGFLKKKAQFPGKIAQLVKCFQKKKKKHENLSLDPQNPQKTQEWVKERVLPLLTLRKWSQGFLEPFNLGRWKSSRFFKILPVYTDRWAPGSSRWF